MALLSDKELTVANVGDSRGVLCDKDGNAVPLSHDHKPYQLKERKRIKKAGENTDAVQESPTEQSFSENLTGPQDSDYCLESIKLVILQSKLSTIILFSPHSMCLLKLTSKPSD